MSEPSHEQAVPEAILARADQALLLARIAASAVALAAFATGELAVSRAPHFRAMLSELGADALPLLPGLLFKFHYPLALGLPVLFVATLAFIWARGKTAAWMALLGLLLMSIIAPLALWALLSPLVQIITEMGNM